MKISTVTVLLITHIVSAMAKTTVLDNSIYKPDSVIYTAQNDIIDIHYSNVHHHMIYVVERKLPDGPYKGLFALKSIAENDTLIPTKVLDNGQCTTSDNETVFFGASDGIYTYNFKTMQAEKYGNITANVKAIQKHPSKDLLYIIANNHLNKITERGTKLQIVESVNNVQEITLDEENNVYLFEKHDAKTFAAKYSKPKVIVDDRIVNIEGLPDSYNQMKLTRTVNSAEGAVLVLDNQLYRIFANGTSLATDYHFKVVPTALYFDLGIVQIFGYDKKLYQYNVILLILQGLSSAISNFYKSIFNH